MLKMDSAPFETVVLTKPQKAIVEKLKAYTRNTLNRSDPFISDFFIFRFLEATAWEEPKAVEMINNYFPFRERMLSQLEDFKTRKGSNHQLSMTRGSKARIKGYTTKQRKGKDILNFIVSWLNAPTFLR